MRAQPFLREHVSKGEGDASGGKAAREGRGADVADLADMIFFHAAHTPKKPAIAFGDAVMNYGRLAREVLAAESNIVAAGLKPGDTVGIAMLNPIGHVIVFCALCRLGIASISLTLNQREEMQQIVLTALLTDTIDESLPVRMILVEESWFTPVKEGQTASISPRRRPDPESIGRLLLSSGTTGRRTVVGVSWRALQERLITLRLATPSWERLVCVSSMHDGVGDRFVSTALWLGKMACLASDATARQAILMHRADLLKVSTGQAAAIVAAQEEEYIRLDSLRAVHVGGSKVHTPLLTRMPMLLCRNIYCNYSAAETGTAACAQAGQIHGLDHAAGYVAPWVEVEIVDADRNPLAAGEEGEIRIHALARRYRYHKLSETEYRLDR